MRVNVIGRGPWGQNIVRTLRELGAEVPLIANRETGWMRAFEESPDRICVAAHPSINLPVVLECEKRGIPVWIEKPAALCLVDVERMAKCKVPIFVDYVHLFRPPREACEYLLAGIMSGRCHDYGMLYDWTPHVLAMTLSPYFAGSYCPFSKPLKNALHFFLDHSPLLFELTVNIHRIIDAAEKLNANR